MHSKIARDHKDHDHYADDVKDIHCFTPIKIPFGVQRPRLLFNNCKDCDLGLSKSAHRGCDQATRGSSRTLSSLLSVPLGYAVVRVINAVSNGTAIGTKHTLPAPLHVAE
jgi:hypothetical protein